MEIFHICISVLLCMCDNIFLPSNYVLSVEFVMGLTVILPDMTPTDISNLLRISNKKLKSSTNPPCCANSVFWNHTNMSYCSLLKDWRWQSDSNSKIYLSAVYISFRFLSCLLATQKKKIHTVTSLCNMSLLVAGSYSSFQITLNLFCGKSFVC